MTLREQLGESIAIRDISDLEFLGASRTPGHENMSNGTKNSKQVTETVNYGTGGSQKFDRFGKDYHLCIPNIDVMEATRSAKTLKIRRFCSFDNGIRGITVCS